MIRLCPHDFSKPDWRSWLSLAHQSSLWEKHPDDMTHLPDMIHLCSLDFDEREWRSWLALAHQPSPSSWEKHPGGMAHLSDMTLAFLPPISLQLLVLVISVAGRSWSESLICPANSPIF